MGVWGKLAELCKISGALMCCGRGCVTPRMWMYMRMRRRSGGEGRCERWSLRWKVVNVRAGPGAPPLHNFHSFPQFSQFSAIFYNFLQSSTFSYNSHILLFYLYSLTILFFTFSSSFYLSNFRLLLAFCRKLDKPCLIYYKVTILLCNLFQNSLFIR